MSGIRRYRRKPIPECEEYAALYQPGQPLGDLTAVARMADPDAELAEAFPSNPVLIIRYALMADDGPPRTDYQVVEPGRYLAYSGGGGFLYGSDDADWEQFYDLVEVHR